MVMIFRDETTSLDVNHEEHHQREGIRMKKIEMMNREVACDNHHKK